MKQTLWALAVALTATPAASDLAIDLADEVQAAVKICMEEPTRDNIMKLLISNALQRAKDLNILDQLEETFASEDARECMGRGLPEKVVWRSDTGDYVRESSYRIWKRDAALREKERRALELEMEREREQQRLELLLEAELQGRVHSSCLELAKRDSVEAYTNALCVRSFRKFGMPE